MVSWHGLVPRIMPAQDKTETAARLSAKPTTENVIVEPSMEIEKTIHDFAGIWSTKD